ncbi:MAG: DUF420 domain-containing protein [Candidatus Binatia bacterium]
MLSLHQLPALNAALNVTSVVLLLVGYRSIRRGRVQTHRACMLAAVGVSTLFLVSYLTYHFEVGSVRFPGTGRLRTIYFAILGTHTLLAVCVPPLVIVTLWRALAARFDRHRRIARWTLPIWLYVSSTGVVIYWMLFHLAGAHG